jgi:hypothetical protein
MSNERSVDVCDLGNISANITLSSSGNASSGVSGLNAAGQRRPSGASCWHKGYHLLRMTKVTIQKHCPCLACWRYEDEEYHGLVEMDAVCALPE